MQARKFPVVHDQHVELDTAKNAITLADWFAEQQLDILAGGREKARQDKRDEVLTLLTGKPAGIQASDVYRARTTRDSATAHALLAHLEAEGVLGGKDTQPEGGGHVTRIFTRAKP